MASQLPVPVTHSHDGFPWDWYVYLPIHEWLIFVVNVDKYTSPMWILWELFSAIYRVPFITRLGARFVGFSKARSVSKKAESDSPVATNNRMVVNGHGTTIWHQTGKGTSSTQKYLAKRIVTVASRRVSFSEIQSRLVIRTHRIHVPSLKGAVRVFQCAKYFFPFRDPWIFCI